MRDQDTVETAVVDALIARAASFGSLPDDELLVVVDELAARRRALDAAIVAAAAEVGARSSGRPVGESLVRRAGYGSVERMLQSRIGIRWHEAKQLCGVAAATTATVAVSGGTIPVPFAHVAEALHAGWLSVAQAHAITSGLERNGGRASVEDLDDAERLLVEVGCGTGDDAEPTTPETLTTAARRCLDFIDPDGDEPRYDDQLATRFLRLSRRRDGDYAIEGRCTADQAEVLLTAFDAHVKPRRVQFQDACGATDEPDTATEGADAVDEGGEAAVDDRTTEQRRIDALVTIVARHAETTSPRISGEAPTLTITVAETALHGHPDTLDDLATLSRSGDTVPVSIAARILCDGFVQVVVQDPSGEPLRLGRRRRLFSKAQRRAIVARDRHCRGPGCTAPPGWCESHHVIPWSQGGRTDVDNGILLCQHHHTEVHRGALTITRAPDTAPDAAEPAVDRTAAPPAPRARRSRTRPRRWRITAAYPRRRRTRASLRR